MVNPRVPKLEDQIQQLVADALERRVKDPRLGFVTVTDVHLTGDTREATVFYTVLGDADALASSAKALESAKGMLRSLVGQGLGLRHTPSLTFVPDATPEAAAHIEELLLRAKESDDAIRAASSGASYAGEADPYRHPREDSLPDDDVDAGDQFGPGPARPQDLS